jgi:hypothetical protein
MERKFTAKPLRTQRKSFFIYKLEESLALLRDLRALAVPGFWFRLIRVMYIVLK